MALRCPNFPAMTSPSNAENTMLLILRTNFRAVVYAYAFPLVLETALAIVHAVLSLYFVYQRWIHRKTMPFASVWLYVVLAMLALLWAYWAIDVYTLWEATELALRVVDVYIPGSTAASGVSLSRSPIIVQLIIQLFILMIGDCVALWRAYVICGRPRWFRILCIALGISFLVLQGVILWAARVGNAVYTIVAVAQLVTCIPQIFSTSLIARKAWLHWKEVREFAHQSGTRYSLAVLIVVIESGVSYVLLYCIYIAIKEGQFSGAYVENYNFFVPLAAMYPILVLLIVAVRKSLLERTVELVSTRNIMRFAEPATGTRRSRTDTEHGLEYATLEAGDHGAAPRVEVSFGSTVEMRNAVLARKESSVHSEHRSEADEDQQPMLTGSPHHSRRSSTASVTDEERGWALT
ncbi:hypothetical protein PENSPDRAFT_145542 [Peniophora sp. CONT]|nr:hypothetical protein PENSPDRAFT_145542 [Peniophora sp. CONT]